MDAELSHAKSKVHEAEREFDRWCNQSALLRAELDEVNLAVDHMTQTIRKAMKLDHTGIHDTDDELITLAKMADQDVHRSKDFYPTSSVSSVVVQLAERVSALTVELRRLKPHDPQAVGTYDDGTPNPYGGERGVCTCGWESAWTDEHEDVLRWIDKHRTFYAAAQ